jgi:S1-C subfamily serine protease
LTDFEILSDSGFLCKYGAYLNICPLRNIRGEKFSQKAMSSDWRWMMTTLENENNPTKKNNRTKWLIGCGTLSLITLCFALFFLLGGVNFIKNLLVGETPELSVGGSISSQAVSVGETFTIEIVVENVGKKNVTITSIKLPGELVNLAIVTDVKPGDIIKQDVENPANYHLDVLIAPTGKQSFTFTFEALKTGTISKDIELQTGEIITPIGISMTISPEITVAAEPDPTPTPILADVIPYQSVVQIIAMVDVEGEHKKAWAGSGTIISEDGLILTNAHVVLSERYYKVVDLLILITQEPDQPPTPMFYADILQADAYVDLAVIKIRSDLNGNPPNLSALGIKPVPLGDSESLKLGDELIMIGYPGIGGKTITVTRGEVSGFTPEEQYGSKAFIKTSGTVAGGNSGGLAANTKGEIVGVPTTLGYGTYDPEKFTDCRPLYDTNRDGVLDNNDNCVPTGGFINALRPVALAIPFIEAAKAGQIAIVEFAPPPIEEEIEPGVDIILEDEFEDNTNGWHLEEYIEANVTLDRGQLLMDIFEENIYAFSELQNTSFYESVILGTYINILNSVGDADFGLICGYQDEGNFTALEISEDGFYTIWALVNNRFTTLVEWAESDIIPDTGPYILTAYCGEDLLYLGVNGTKLVESYNPDYRGGNVGLIAGTYQNPNFSIGFENFLILRP